MSHIGKEFINIPSNVRLSIRDNTIEVEGKHGKITRSLPPNMIFISNGNKLYLLPSNYIEDHKKIDKTPEWGTMRTIINNMIIGVNQGFTKKLQLVGIGFKVSMENNTLLFNLGFSHVISYKIPEGLKIEIIKPTLISIFGIDKEFVTKISAQIRSLKKPEPYKGKGIKYSDEIIIKKEGKKK